MSEIKNLTLAFKCTERIDAKQYCKKCAHTIIDFTQKTDQELVHEINASARPVCGVFKRSQLSDQFLRYAVTTVIVTTAATISAFGQESKASAPVTLTAACDKNEGEMKDYFFQGVVLFDQAEPVGGYDKFYRELFKAIQLPPGLKSSGELFIELDIDAKGQVTDYRVIEGFNKKVDKEVLRAVKSLNYSFTPGRQRDKPVPVRLIIPVKIDEQKKNP